MKALIAHFYPGLDINTLTYPEIDDYISQIWYVVPMVRIRYYLKDLKDAYFQVHSEKGSYHPDPEYDEDEDEQTRKDDELYKAQLEALKHGIKPPKGWA